MNATQQLHELGQSLWLDNIIHALLTSGTLDRYIREFAVTGLTSNPTIFDHAIKNGGFYDDAIRRRARAGIPAIEESIFAGVPVNVTLLFSREHYIAAAEAYMRGIERRIVAGRDPRVVSVASVFVSRWDVAVKEKVPDALRNRLGIAVAMRTYKAYRELLGSPRWQKLAARGAQPQRLLWGITGTKDPTAPDTLYVEALAAPNTINTMPEKPLLAFADHGGVKGVMPIDGGNAEIEDSAPMMRVLVDARALAFSDATFDTIATAATVCSKSGLLGRGPVDRGGSVR